MLHHTDRVFPHPHSSISGRIASLGIVLQPVRKMESIFPTTYCQAKTSLVACVPTESWRFHVRFYWSATLIYCVDANDDMQAVGQRCTAALIQWQQGEYKFSQCGLSVPNQVEYPSRPPNSTDPGKR